MDKPIRISDEAHADGRKLHIEAKKIGLGILTHDQIYKAGVEVWRGRIERKSKQEGGKA